MGRGFTRLRGIAAPYPRRDVLMEEIAPPEIGAHDHGALDIAPHEHPAPEEAGAGARRPAHAFEFERFLADGEEDPAFILNQAPYRNASILLAGANFGGGGTHTPAVARLLGCGFRAVVAPSFGPVFHNDCLRQGLFPLVLAQEPLNTLAAATAAAPHLPMTIDLAQQTLARPDSGRVQFQMNPRLLTRFMRGLADEDETMPFQDEAEAFRKAQQTRQPWIYQTNGDPQ